MAKHLQILRNSTISTSREAAKTALLTQLAKLNDGELAINRYQDGTQVKVLFGFNNTVGTNTKQFVFDSDSIPADVQTQLDKLNGDGDGSISKQIEAAKIELIGSDTDTKDSKTIYGAKKYADNKVNNLNLNDAKVNGSFVTEVKQVNGQIGVSRAEITSTDKSLTLSDQDNGNVDFSVNIDGTTILKDSTTGKLSVASSALTQYVGSNAVNVSSAVNNEKTISLKINQSDAILSQDTDGLLSTISLSYDETNKKIKLVGKNSTEISTIDATKFIKDGMLAGESVFMATKTSQSVTIKSQSHTFTNLTVGHHYIALMFSNNNGGTTTYSWDILDATSIIDVYKAGNGLILGDDNHTFSAKINTTATENYLSVDGDGLKVSGINNAITNAIAKLDVSDTAVDNQFVTAVSETDGKITVSRAVVPYQDAIDKAVTAIDNYVGKSSIPSGKTVMGVIVENEETAATAINEVATAAGVLNASTQKVEYIAPTQSGVFSNTTSIMSMLNLIDSTWNSSGDYGTY